MFNADRLKFVIVHHVPFQAVVLHVIAEQKLRLCKCRKAEIGENPGPAREIENSDQKSSGAPAIGIIGVGPVQCPAALMGKQANFGLEPFGK